MNPTIATPARTRLAAGETALKTARGTYLRSTPTNRGFNPVTATVTLTDRHLLIVPEHGSATLAARMMAAMGALDPVKFPLAHICSVGVYPKTVWGRPDVLRLEFDNGGREYLWVQPASEWRAALDVARLAAPDQPYSTLPAVNHGVEASAAGTTGRVLLALLGAAVAAALACGLLGALVGLVR